MADVYDVAVLGSGPGGYAAAIHAAQAGLKTVIVEKQARLGGTCTLVGCIPTKAFLNSADLVEEIRGAADHGIAISGSPKVDMAGVITRKNKIVEQSTSGVSFLMKKNKIDVVTGFGKIAGKGKLEVQGEGGAKQEVRFKNLILATGSSVREFPGLESDGKVVLNSDQILDLEKIPKRLIVVGGGAVGMEFASVFAAFGSEVTLVELMPHLLPLEDEEISKEVERAYRKRKIAFHLESKVEKLERSAKGVKATVVGKGKTQVIEADMLLSAIGRKPMTEGIGLETVGIETERGFIPVDEMMRTKAEGIYAIGDIVPTAMLAHLAQHEAALAVDHIAGRKAEPIRYDRCPNATYCSPEVASVGLTEKAAREKGYDVKVGKFPFMAIGKARIVGQTAGMVKIVSESKYDEVLGVHIVGPKATELIAEACAALRLEATTEDLVKAIHPHPTLSEAMGEAAFAVSGKTLHM